MLASASKENDHSYRRAGTMNALNNLREKHQAIKKLNLSLNIERGQPGDENFDLADPMLSVLGIDQRKSQSGTDLRNYPGGAQGIPEARALFSSMLRIEKDEIIVGNNSSLQLMSQVFMWAMIRGLLHSDEPWCTKKAKMIVTVPGYDRHFLMLQQLGFDLVTVPMTPEGPDIQAIESLASSDPEIKGLVFVPTYSNPTGDTVSDRVVERLAGMPTRAKDFTIFADDAYCVHHLTDTPKIPKNLLKACKEQGHPERVILYGSTSKMTYAGAGIGFLGASQANIGFLTKLFGYQSITFNKLEQYRHVLFLNNYSGGIPGIMQRHATILKPKFEAVQRVLHRELGGKNLATWSNPEGGYFVSLDTTRPIAARVVELTREAGVALTPAGATYPSGKDPHNRNIRISPSRPPVSEVEKAMEILALCIQLASEEYDTQQARS